MSSVIYRLYPTIGYDFSGPRKSYGPFAIQVIRVVVYAGAPQPCRDAGYASATRRAPPTKCDGRGSHDKPRPLLGAPDTLDPGFPPRLCSCTPLYRPTPYTSHATIVRHAVQPCIRSVDAQRVHEAVVL